MKNEVLRLPENFLSIDPGNVQSAFILWDRNKPVNKMRHGIVENELLLDMMDAEHWVGMNHVKGDDRAIYCDHVVIEMPEDMGRSDDSLFETAFWAGMFAKGWDASPSYTLIYRHQVKSHLKANNDARVRASLLRRFGQSIEKDFAYDEWQALGLAVTFEDYCRLVF